MAVTIFKGKCPQMMRQLGVMLEKILLAPVIFTEINSVTMDYINDE